MPAAHEIHSSFSNSSSSSSSRSSSTERHSYPTTTTTTTTARTTTNHHNHRKIHSAPATFPPTYSNLQTPASSSLSTSTDTDSTLIDPSSYSAENPTFRSAFEKEAGDSKPKRHLTESPPQGDAEPKKGVKSTKRTCTAGTRLEFDWTYANVYTSGSRHGGRRTIGSGSGAPGGCALM